MNNINTTKDDSRERAFSVISISDIGATAALMSAGFELLTVDKKNPRKAMFIFQRTSEIEHIINEYFANHLQVQARSFFDHIKALKSRLYSE
jgi:hypothetical protein